MTNSPAAVGGSKMRKLMIQMTVGAVSGALVMFGLLNFVDSAGIDLDNPSRVIALGTAAVFAIMGLFVALGVMAPGPGARFLNVEDEGDLREQRSTLWHGALMMLALAAMVFGLALGGDGGLLTRAASAVIFVLGLLATIGISVAGKADGDEFTRSIARESSAYSMYACTILLGLWAAASHLGYAGWIDPLGLLSALLIIQFGTMMIVCAARGLLSPR